MALVQGFSGETGQLTGTQTQAGSNEAKVAAVFEQRFLVAGTAGGGGGVGGGGAVLWGSVGSAERSTTLGVLVGLRGPNPGDYRLTDVQGDVVRDVLM